MNKEQFTTEEKKICLYRAGEENCPMIVLNHFGKDADGIARDIIIQGGARIDLLCVYGLNWNNDMTPWYCPPVMKGDAPYTGGADEYLKLLTGKIIPKALTLISGKPDFIGIAGYSLAGLFALYSLYHTDIFSRAASMSGSLWFPDFTEYAGKHTMLVKPDRLYLSLGDKEDHTKNRLLKTVRENTERLAKYYREEQIDAVFELNSGNHFEDASARICKGIKYIV